MCRPAESVLTRTSELVKGRPAEHLPGFSHPGLTSSWFCSRRSGNLSELECLEVGICIFSNQFLEFLYKHVVYQFITKGYDWGTGRMELHRARYGERAQSSHALSTLTSPQVHQLGSFYNWIGKTHLSLA